MRLALAFAILATPLSAGVGEVVSDHILPGLSGFAEKAQALAAAAEADCGAEALKPPFNAAFDAWEAIGDMRIGPSEHAALSIAFWPDDRGFTQRTLRTLVSEEDPIISSADAFADVSVAGRGLFALEMLLYDDAYADHAPGGYVCRLTRAVATDLARQAQALDSAWQDAFARTLTQPGPDNATYMSEDEAFRAVYTQILSGLEFTRDSRIGRPLGTFDRPRPKRAEAWRSGRSLRDVILSTEAAVAEARLLAGHELPETEAALERMHDAAARVSDPAFQDVGDPSSRLKVEIVQQRVKEVERAIEEEVGQPMGITPGFNSQDGD